MHVCILQTNKLELADNKNIELQTKIYLDNQATLASPSEIAMNLFLMVDIIVQEKITGSLDAWTISVSKTHISADYGKLQPQPHYAGLITIKSSVIETALERYEYEALRINRVLKLQHIA